MALDQIALNSETGVKYRQLIRQLENRIHSGELTPGMKLPGERYLAKRFGVAVCTVSSALKELANRQLVERRVGAGTFVTSDKGGCQARFTPKVAVIFRYSFCRNQPGGYIATILSELYQFFENHNYDLLPLVRTPEQYRQCFEEYHLQGMLIYSPLLEYLPKIQELRDLGYPVVILSSYFPEQEKISFGYSNTALMHDAVQYLLGLGHRKIGHVINRGDAAILFSRDAGFRQAMWEARLPVNPDWATPLEMADFSAGIRRMLTGAERPSAIILGASYLADEFYRILKELNLEVPDDLSVLCIGENEGPSQTYRVPSAFRIQVAELTLAGAAGLLAMIESRPRPDDQDLHYELVDHGSCRRIMEEKRATT